MKNYSINAENIDDEIFEYWIRNDRTKPNNISKLISSLKGANELNVGDIISVQFDTKKIGFERNFTKDFSSNKFQISYKQIEYIYLKAFDEYEVFEEYFLDCK